MPLDIRTLVVDNGLILGFLALVLLFYQAQQKTCRGFRFWTAGVVTVAAAYLLVALRSLIGTGASVLLGNFGFVLGAVLQLEGTLRFRRNRRLPRRWYLLPWLVTLSMAWFYFVQDNIALRNLLAGLAVGLVLLAAAWLLLREPPPFGRLVYQASGLMLVSFTLAIWTRAVLWLHAPLMELFSSTGFNQTYFVATELLQIGIVFGYLLMNAQRLEAELAASNGELDSALGDLRESLEQVRVLKGLLPICQHCKNIRDEAGDWQLLETYIKRHSHADFSHGVCPECARRYYPDLYGKLQEKGLVP